jgi:hypothetical protein
MDLAVLEQRVRLMQQTLDEAIQSHDEATKTYYRKKSIWLARLEQRPEAAHAPTEADQQICLSMSKALDAAMDACRHMISRRIALIYAKNELQNGKDAVLALGLRWTHAEPLLNAQPR